METTLLGVALLGVVVAAFTLAMIATIALVLLIDVLKAARQWYS